MSERSCLDVRADLSAYLDGDLDAGLAGETRLHLERCAACRAELDLLRLTVGALRRLPDLPPPAAILAGVRARLRPEPWSRRLLDGRQWPLGVPVGALATLLVVVGISLFQTRYPDLTKTVPQGHFPQSPAPLAPIAQPAPAGRPMVADRQIAPPARDNLRAKGTLGSVTKSPVTSQGKEVAASESTLVAGADKKDSFRVEPVAPTVLSASGAKVERALPSPPESRVATKTDAPREESQPLGNLEVMSPKDVVAKPEPAPLAKEYARESRALFERNADSGAGMRYAKIAEEKKAESTRVEVACLLYPDGDSIVALEKLLLREGARNTLVSVLEPREVREAFVPYRGRVDVPSEPSRGWTVTAGIAPSEISRLLDALKNWKSLRILSQPAAPSAPKDAAEPLDLRITVFR